MKPINKGKALGFYVVIFGALFLQFPLAGSLPGKVDTWFFVAAFNAIGSNLHAFFGHTVIGSAMYPAANTIYWGNYSFGQAIFFLPFRYLGFSDIYSYYFLVVAIFSLNAFGVFLINTKLGLRNGFAFIGGIFFACCNFSFGTLDNPDALFFGNCFLSIYFFIKYLESPKWRDVIVAALLAATGVYFSSYNFLFNVLILGICLFLYNPAFVFKPKALLQLILCSVMAIIVLIPYLKIYVLSNHLLSGFNPAHDIHSIVFTSIHFKDLFRVIPGNVLYPISTDMDVNWLYKTRSLFTGISLAILSIAGLAVVKKYRLLVVTTWLIFFLISVGPFLVFNGNYYEAPMYVFYKYVHINNFFRINIRAYFGCVLVMSFLGAAALQYLSTSIKYSWLIIIVLVAFFCLENIPYEFQKYPSKILLEQAGDMIYPNGKELKNVMHLPSSIAVINYPGFKQECAHSEIKDYEFCITRDYIYMWLQAKSRQNIINGFTGFLPHQRVANQFWIQDILVNGNLDRLIDSNGLTNIVFHKKFRNGCDYTDVVSMLKGSPRLNLISETDKIIGFDVIPLPAR